MRALEAAEVVMWVHSLSCLHSCSTRLLQDHHGLVSVCEAISLASDSASSYPCHLHLLENASNGGLGMKQAKNCVPSSGSAEWF